MFLYTGPDLLLQIEDPRFQTLKSGLEPVYFVTNGIHIRQKNWDDEDFQRRRQGYTNNRN